MLGVVSYAICIERFLRDNPGKYFSAYELVAVLESRFGYSYAEVHSVRRGVKKLVNRDKVFYYDKVVHEAGVWGKRRFYTFNRSLLR